MEFSVKTGFTGEDKTCGDCNRNCSYIKEPVFFERADKTILDVD